MITAYGYSVKRKGGKAAHNATAMPNGRLGGLRGQAESRCEFVLGTLGNVWYHKSAGRVKALDGIAPNVV